MGDSFLEKNGVGPRPRICGRPGIYMPVAPERDQEMDINAKMIQFEGEGVAVAFDVLLHCISVEVHADRLYRAILLPDAGAVIAEVCIVPHGGQVDVGVEMLSFATGRYLQCSSRFLKVKVVESAGACRSFVILFKTSILFTIVWSFAFRQYKHQGGVFIASFKQLNSLLRP